MLTKLHVFLYVYLCLFVYFCFIHFGPPYFDNYITERN